MLTAGIFLSTIGMMKYKIEFSKKSLKAFLALPKLVQGHILKKIEILTDDPYASRNDVKKLQGMEDCYRLRAGDYRVLYQILKAKIVIEVINIAHRKEAYK